MGKELASRAAEQLALRRLRRHLPISWGGGSNSNKETRRRLQRTPPRPGSHRVTRFWFLRRFTAVAYLWRPTFARTVGGPGRRTNCLHSATIRCHCQGLWHFSRLLHLR